jgi:hypothetical protein
MLHTSASLACIFRVPYGKPRKGYKRSKAHQKIYDVCTAETVLFLEIGKDKDKEDISWWHLAVGGA